MHAYRFGAWRRFHGAYLQARSLKCLKEPRLLLHPHPYSERMEIPFSEGPDRLSSVCHHLPPPQLPFTALLVGLIQQVVGNLNTSENCLNISTTSCVADSESKVYKHFFFLSIRSSWVPALAAPCLVECPCRSRLGLLNWGALNICQRWSITKAIQALVNLKFYVLHFHETYLFGYIIC